MSERVKLTPAQISAIECRMDGDEQVDGLVVDRGYLLFDDIERTLDALTDASNSEDVTAQETLDPDLRKMANRASKSLATVSDYVVKRANAA